MNRAIVNRVIVTGGSTGIGLAICRGFLDAGYAVVALDRQPADFAHPQFRVLPVDLCDEAATRAALQDAVRQPVTTIVHNAGVIRPALAADATTDDMAELSRLHLGTALLLLQATLPAMRAARFGRVVLISSRAALGLATRTAYSATKAGLIGMARTWALELGPDGITVNAIAPGPIAGTAMFHDVLPPGDPRIDALAQGIPVRRLGQPQDVARAALFLAHPDSGFITGQTLFVCGGTSVGSLAL
jgi:NAD(P)-dependent dehydrogenase (short-subunit alcohol dehydrogenase family)